MEEIGFRVPNVADCLILSMSVTHSIRGSVLAQRIYDSLFLNLHPIGSNAVDVGKVWLAFLFPALAVK